MLCKLKNFKRVHKKNTEKKNLSQTIKHSKNSPSL